MAPGRRWSMEPMRDIVIGWENGDELACIDAPSSSRWKGKIIRLREKYPEAVPVFVQNPDGSITAKFLVKLLSLRNPSDHKKELTEEQKEALMGRLEKMREAKRLKSLVE